MVNKHKNARKYGNINCFKEGIRYLKKPHLNPVAFILCLENNGDRINTSAGLEQLYQQIREIKTSSIQAVKFRMKE